MTQYRNKRTGAIITIPGIITGEVWERVDVAPTRETKPAPKVEVETPKPKKEVKAPKKRSKKK